MCYASPVGGENSGHFHMSPLKHQDFFDTDHVYTWHIYQDKVSMQKEAEVQRPLWAGREGLLHAGKQSTPKVRPVDCLRKGGVVATGNSAVAGVAEVLTQRIFL